ncbi:MAG: hypothetical protein EA398_05715 [Deltaproteobacteria bacterium]|nr:MAG: hypothetical protein EA398_05715 [Deltaproteobacteria bacterium]
MRHAATHSSVLAGERYGRGILRPMGGRSSLAIVVRAAGNELLEVSALRLDDDGFGSLRLEVRRADVTAISTELRDLIARGAEAACIATDGSAAADAVARQLTGRVSLRTGTRAIRRHARARLGLESLPGEGRAYREVLAERFMDGSPAAGTALREMAEVDCATLMHLAGEALATERTALHVAVGA